jgi:hypothetical protein
MDRRKDVSFEVFVSMEFNKIFSGRQQGQGVRVSLLFRD